MHCLIIEDEIDTSRYIRDGLAALGYTAVACHVGSDRLHHAWEYPWDVIIIEQMLGGSSDVLALVEPMRAVDNETPVIVLGALADTPGRATGPRPGAAASLGEPFGFSEWLSRVEALVHGARAATPGEPVRARFG